MVRGSWGPQVTEVTKQTYLDSSLTKYRGRNKIRLAVALTRCEECTWKPGGVWWAQIHEACVKCNERSACKDCTRAHQCGCQGAVSVSQTHTSQSKWGWAGRLTARGRSRRPRPVHQLNLQMRELSQTKYVKIWKWQMCEGAVVRFTWCNVNGEAMRRPGLTGGQSLGLRMKEG